MGFVGEGMDKKMFVYAAVLAVLLMGVTGVLSIKDMRVVDGPLTVGFPLPFFVKSSGFGGEVVSGVFWIGLFVDLVLAYLISLGLAWGALRVLS